MINIEKEEIPDSVKYIGISAFEGCESLKEIRLPKSIKEIGENAFDGTPFGTARVI